MNKGIEIWLNKRKKKTQKRNTVKDNQIEICRFINFKNPKTERVNGKYRFAGFETLTGLQIENKLYYVKNEKECYVFINKSRAKVLRVYSDDEIHNFHPLLLQRYSKTKNASKNIGDTTEEE